MKTEKDIFPDGTRIDPWFYNTKVASLDELGKRYVITDYGVKDDGKVYTKEIQAVIDTIAENGGGVLIVPSGAYFSGALFFKKGVNLYVAEGGVLKGSDDISDYPLMNTRIEGECCLYYPALINADGVDGFTMFGEGAIDGNGARSWRAFWQRLEWNPKATNKDEQRPRLVYISNSKNVTIAGLELRNSLFWTTHIYKCENVRYLGCRFFAPRTPVRAPSSDAIDIDVCKRVLVKNCYIEVNDDAVVLKGGKGRSAHLSSDNGANEEILIEDCEFGWCHSCFTCGSESIHDRNVIFRRSKVNGPWRLFLCKMRADTLQNYEYIEMSDITGSAEEFFTIMPFGFSGDEKRTDLPLSEVRHISVRNCDCKVKKCFNVVDTDGLYGLSDFVFENLNIKAEISGSDSGVICAATLNNVVITDEEYDK